MLQNNDRNDETEYLAQIRQGIEAIVCPAHALVAPKHTSISSTGIAGSYTQLYNLLDFPAGEPKSKLSQPPQLSTSNTKHKTQNTKHDTGERQNAGSNLKAL
jgi:hypothetical protein